MDRDELDYIERTSIGGTSTRGDNLRNVLMIRGARNEEERHQIIEAVLRRRAQHRLWITLTQREWQAKVSRRPSRGRNHDSWAIREGYVTGRRL